MKVWFFITSQSLARCLYSLLAHLKLLFGLVNKHRSRLLFPAEVKHWYNSWPILISLQRIRNSSSSHSSRHFWRLDIYFMSAMLVFSQFRAGPSLSGRNRLQSRRNGLRIFISNILVLALCHFLSPLWHRGHAQVRVPFILAFLSLICRTHLSVDLESLV